jgi:TolB-like protein
MSENMMNMMAIEAFTEGLTSRNLSVLQQVQSLSVDRPYSKFSFKELKAATASFSPSKFKSH